MSGPQHAIDYARALVGKAKWRHRGRTPWAVDCAGLVVLSLEAAGFRVQDERHYGRHPWRDGVRAAIQRNAGSPVKGAWLPGDVAVVQWKGAPEPSHMGLLADYRYGGLSIIHAHNGYGVAEHRLDAAMREQIVEVYRVWQS